MNLAEQFWTEGEHPIDMLEWFATLREWDFVRTGQNEITLRFSGTMADYSLSVSHLEHIDVLHMACSFELSAPKIRITELRVLITLINERIWLGHFDYWEHERSLVFRISQALDPETAVSGKQIERLVSEGSEQCDQFYPAFHYVAWAHYTAQQAMEAVRFETSGVA